MPLEEHRTVPPAGPRESLTSGSRVMGDAVLNCRRDVVDLDGADVTGKCAGVVLQVELLRILDIEDPVKALQGDQSLGGAVQNPRGLTT